MQATSGQIASLVKLQEVDRERFQAEAQLASMPHRQQVLDGRSKRKEVQARFDQVDALLADARSQVQKLSDEDGRLVARQDELQGKIDEAQGDYRSVTALTRDLEGAAKRRETIAFQLGKARERIDEVMKVHESARSALEAIDSRERELVADYQERSQHLAHVAQQAQAQRASLVTAIPDDVLAAYDAALGRCGGIGLAHLRDGKCSACRSSIDPNRLLQIRKEAPVSSCPNCSRVLVVE